MGGGYTRFARRDWLLFTNYRFAQLVNNNLYLTFQKNYDIINIENRTKTKNHISVIFYIL